MFPQRLQQLLTNPFSPDLARQGLTICNEWWQAQPCVVVFVLRTMFAEMTDRWEDEQGVETAQFEPFQQRLPPLILAVIDDLLAGSPKTSADNLEALVRAYQECLIGPQE
jgi:hypothetical protein